MASVGKDMRIGSHRALPVVEETGMGMLESVLAIPGQIAC